MTSKNDSSGDGDGTATNTAPTEAIPLIELPAIDEDRTNLKDVASKLVKVLQTSGFLLVQSPELSLELQLSAVEAASQILIGTDGNANDSSGKRGVEGVIDHPTDPKLYLMMDSVEDIKRKCKTVAEQEIKESSSDRDPASILIQYWKAMENVKKQVLTCIAIGLKLGPDFFVKLHSENQSALRLLHYYPPPTGESKDKPTNASIRCKPHSDYGSVTLLSTDGVPGLQALIQDEWTPVPYVKGALVVNIGSLLQNWTNGKLLATLHRVVTLRDDPAKPRTSLAFFADPDPNVSAILKDPAGMVPTANMYRSVADYIQWRSGGKGRQRSGLAFSKEEEERAKRAKTS